MKALVTGAGGFIGSHLVERLVADGVEVRALVRYGSRGDRGQLERLGAAALEAVELVAGDVRDPFRTDETVRGCSVVYHLAALIAIPYSYAAPRSYVDTNVGGTLNVLQACLRHGVERVVHTSTSECYGTARRVPIDEEHPLQAQSPYAASKVGADMIAQSYHRAYGLQVAVLRPFNTYGPGQSARAVIPTVVAQALAGGPVRLGALAPSRDFTYVTDTVDAFVRAAAHDAAVGEVIHAGTGRETSIGELARLVLGLAGSEAAVEHDPDRLRPPASEVDRLVADPTKAARLLGWRPRVPLEEGLSRTIDWHRAHADLGRAASYAT
jgi:NAD dependent epimerase/dehydratase